jgi:hypothetical protein
MMAKAKLKKEIAAKIKAFKELKVEPVELELKLVDWGKGIYKVLAGADAIGVSRITFKPGNLPDDDDFNPGFMKLEGLKGLDKAKQDAFKRFIYSKLVIS